MATPRPVILAIDDKHGMPGTDWVGHAGDKFWSRVGARLKRGRTAQRRSLRTAPGFEVVTAGAPRAA